MPDVLRKAAHAWDDALHPRDEHGRFINKGENVKLPDGSVGKVVGSRGGSDGPSVLVHKGDGSVVSVRAADTSITAKAPSPPPDMVSGPPAPVPTPRDPLPGLPHESEPGSDTVTFDAAVSNPDYSQGGGYAINCANVVNAYELRRRGYAVSAEPLPRNVSGRSVQQVLDSWTDSNGQPRMMTLTRTANVANIVSTWPPGARGWIAVNWKTGGGHVFNVEKDPAAGSISYVDAQTNTIMDPQTVQRYWGRATSLAKVVRVDDLTPTAGVLQFVEPTPSMVGAQ